MWIWRVRSCTSTSTFNNSGAVVGRGRVDVLSGKRVFVRHRRRLHFVFMSSRSLCRPLQFRAGAASALCDDMGILSVALGLGINSSFALFFFEK